MGGVSDVVETVVTEGAGTEGTLWVIGGLGQVGVAVTAAKDTKQRDIIMINYTYMYMYM